MFGYIRPVQGELLVKEYEFYKAVYCGLCREGGRRISRLTRFFLNHDFVFLYITRIAVTGEGVSASVKRCPYNLKKRCMVGESFSLTYTAAAFGVLLYYKILDDVRDSKGIKRLFKRIPLVFASPMKNRAVKLYPDLDKNVRESLEKLSGLESSGCSSPDLAADAFAGLTSYIASYGTEGKTKRVLEDCGYHIGRYVYYMDAFEDAFEDSYKKSFNPLCGYYGTPELVLESADEIQTTLKDSMAAFLRAYESAGDKSYDNLVKNIAFLGSKAAFEKSLENLKGNHK